MTVKIRVKEPQQKSKVATMLQEYFKSVGINNVTVVVK